MVKKHFRHRNEENLKKKLLTAVYHLIKNFKYDYYLCERIPHLDNLPVSIPLQK